MFYLINLFCYQIKQQILTLKKNFLKIFQLMLNDKECEEIYLKWIEHLISGKQMVIT